MNEGLQRIQAATLALFAGTRLGNAFAALFNRYESAQPGSPRRSWVPAFVRDARYDANSFTRWELARKIRYFERNLWLIKRLKEVHMKYTVGPHGLPVIPSTSDHDWNQKAHEAYCEWCESPALDSLLSMGQIHRLISGETHIDGEIFVLKTRRKTVGQSIPAVQLIESHRVSTPGGDFSTAENQNVVDGVEVDSTGRPTGYWVRDGFDGGEWNLKPASAVVHVGNPDRVGMYRCVTPYHATLNTGHDLDDLEMYEMQRAKANAEEAKILETPSGELPRSMLQREAFLSQSGTGGVATIPNDQIQAQLEQYKTILGARTIALPTGTKLTTPSNPSPSAAQQWFWHLKMSQVAMSVSIPMLLVLPESVQGTVARAVLDDAHLSFRAWFSEYARAAREMYRYYIAWARFNDPRLVDAPADWQRCHIVPPRACNVDVGRSSQAMLAEMAAGVISLDDVTGANGSTAEVQIRKRARDIGRIKQIAAEESKRMGVEIKPEEISSQLADSGQKVAQAELYEGQAEQAEQAAGEEETPKEETNET